jgi:pimeloyl-ACP methyl ester carboxylesterase
MPSEKPPLVLLHGVTSSGQAWDALSPALSKRFDVFAPSALGHRGGEPVRHSPTTLSDVVDAAERYLDTNGLDRPHLVGHSMGGFVAIELARRGRAATVTAFSPAGFWTADDPIRTDIAHSVRRSALLARWAGPLLKLAVSTNAGRRFMMGTAMLHPERMTRAEARTVIRDHAACTLASVLQLAETDIVAPLDPLPCPVTVAWAAEDDILPMAKYQAAVRNRLPTALFLTLPDVGHAAMVDDRDLVIHTIERGTGVTD